MEDNVTAKWIMDSRARSSKKYRDLHDQLRREVQAERETKPERKRRKSSAFKATGEIHGQ